MYIRSLLYKILLAIVLAPLRWILMIRYRIQVRGDQNVFKDVQNSERGILFLSNHVSLLDFFILFSLFGSRFKIRPIGYDEFYYSSVVAPFMKWIGGVPLPGFDSTSNELKIKWLNESIHTIVEGLKAGQRFLLFPTGRLKLSAKESVKGVSLTHSILQSVPDVDVVMIRISGLWGSSFSRAQTGSVPDMRTQLIKSLKLVLKNGIFFSPRRKIRIDLELNPNELPRHSSRIEINRYLDFWYNRYLNSKGEIVQEEPLYLVRESFWTDTLPQVTDLPSSFKLKPVDVSNEIRTKIYNEIRRILNDPVLKINDEMDLAEDLGMDSLNRADLIVFLIKNWGGENIGNRDIEKVQCVLNIAAGLQKKIKDTHPSSILSWAVEENRPHPLMPEGKSILEAFLQTADRMGSFAAVGDDLIGILSYKKIKKSVLVLAEKLRSLSGPRIGVLLPASASAYITIFAIQAAGKVPVILNWTLGPFYLDQMVSSSQIDTVLSSRRFIDRLSHVDFGKTIHKIQFLEDLKAQLTFKHKVWGVFLSTRTPSQQKKILKLDRLSEDEPSIILFTSGTEGSPKGVPLSNRNLLSNLRSGFDHFDMMQIDQAFYSVLPPYHVFGLLFMGFAPLLAGMRVAFYPNPTDSQALAEGIERWKITMMGSPPSFIMKLFEVAKPEQLSSLRIILVGADKVPSHLSDRITSLGIHAQLLEGYGITEACGAVSSNLPDSPSIGVGKLFSIFELITIDLENQCPLPEGEEGEICLRSSSILNGYIGQFSSPFIEINGKSWYRTGDIGWMDQNKYIHLTDRLKRFTKIGGEMISLGAIENVLKCELKKSKEYENSSLAVCADQADTTARLVLFITRAIEKDKVNEILQKAGFSNLIKISTVKVVEELPVTAIGKLNYKLMMNCII